MDNQHYFPPPYGRVECGECDMASACHSRGKYQRDRRDFTYTSGRCPRLPDCKGTAYLRNPGYNGTDGGSGGNPAKRDGKSP